MPLLLFGLDADASEIGGGVPLAFLPIKYATAVTIPFTMIKRGVMDLAVSADWTPATGDVKVRQDAGSFANVGTLPSILSVADWGQPLTTGETTGKFVSVQIIDSATKAVEDNELILFTYGHASAYWPFDLSTAMSGQAVASVTGNVGGNLVGSAASVTAGVIVTTNNDKTGYSLTNPAGMKKNTALAAVTVEMRNATTGLLMTGLTVTAQRKIDSGSFAACANAIAEVGTTGIYVIDLAASDLNGDWITFKFTATGARETVMRVLTEP